MKLLKPILKVITALLISLAFIFWLFSWISPEQFPVAGVGYLLFPYLGFISLCVLLVFLFLFPKRRIILLVLIVVLAWQLLSFTGWRLSSIMPAECSNGSVSLLSFNVNNFGLFEWKDKVAVRDSFADLIERLNPDLICFQDFYTRHHQEELDNVFYFQHNLGYNYHYFSPTLTNHAGHQWGLAIFSKFPITDTAFVDFSGNYTGANTNGVQLVNVNKDGFEFRLLNYHLESYHLGRHYNLKKTEKTYSLRWWYQNMPGIVKFMLPSMKNKTRQANMIAGMIEQSDLPVIAAGDMNNIAGSYIYRKIHENLYDTAYGSREFIPVTLNGFPPFFRIDFVGVSAHWQVCNYQVPNFDYSNHFPVFVELDLKP